MSNNEFDELTKRLDVIEKRFDQLQGQVLKISVYIQGHENLHKNYVNQYDDLTEEDLVNIVGAPFLNKKEK